MEPTVDPEESRERIDHILCKDDNFSPENLEEEAIYEEKEGDWGTGMSSGNPWPPIREENAENRTTAHAAVWGSGIPTGFKEESKKNPEAETPPCLNAEGGSKVRHDSKRDVEAEEPMTGAKTGPKD